jgi:4-hydroxy-tetrahydrodipicolinate synthase
MSRPLTGVLPIVHTPFTESGSIDRDVLQREVDWGFTVGIDGIGTGMVSELLRLTAAERCDLAAMLVDATAGRGCVFMGVGAESTKQAVVFAMAAERAGCDAIMATPPVTTRITEAGLLSYFQALADEVDLPVIVQDASGYVGQPIPLPLYVELLDRYGPEKILFKPEASPIGPQLSAVRDITGGRARIYEGSGGLFLVDSYRRGIAGTMPGMDLVDGVVRLWQALQRGDDEAAYRLSFPLAAIVAQQLQAGLDGFLAIEKYLLVKRGVFPSARRREPYAWELDDETAAEIDRLFARFQQAVAESTP